MRRLFLMCLAAVLLTAGVTSAVTWNPTLASDPNCFVNGYSNWNIAANWGGTLPGGATFTGVNRPVCWVTDARTSGGLLVASGGGPCSLMVKNGGRLSLTGTGFHAVGHDHIGTLTIEKGGIVTSTARVMIGRLNTDNVAPSYIIVDGGTLELTAGNLQVGYQMPTGWGKLRVDKGGLVDIKNGTVNNYMSGTTYANKCLDVRFGTIIQKGDQTTNLLAWKNLNELVAFDGKGTLVWDYNSTTNKTTITAIHPMTPSPAFGPILFEGTVTLTWKNMDPNTPGNPVYVDVWCGTEPNKLNPAKYTKVVDKGTNTTTVNVAAPVVGTSPTTYYWQVDSYLGGTPTGTPVAGDVFEFVVTNDFPPTVVIDTPNMATWGDPNESVPVQLDATITDSGNTHSPVTYTWTSSPAGVVFSNPTGVDGNPDTTAKVTPATFPATYTLTCSVKDAGNPTVTNTDTVQLVVYANACLAARRPGASEIQPTDMDGDCDTDLDDLYVALLDWTRDYTLLVPTVIP
jgi:hypothetical protein